MQVGLLIYKLCSGQIY